MDHRGRRILIGILTAIVGGVSLYFAAYSAATFPLKKGVQAAVTASDLRPAADGAMSPEAGAVSRAMVGMWRSTDDPRFTREFKEDGTVIDRYESVPSATRKGIWGAFTADMAEGGTATGLAGGVVYIQITINDASLYFSVVRAADTLQLVYLNRGGQSNFTRV